LKKGHTASLEKKFLDYLSSYYTEHVHRAAAVVNFVYEYKFARFYRKRKKTATFTELLNARSQSLEQNYNDLAYIMEKSRADGYVPSKTEKDWQRHVKRSKLFTEESFNQFEKRREKHSRKDAAFEQMVNERAPVD